MTRIENTFSPQIKLNRGTDYIGYIGFFFRNSITLDVTKLLEKYVLLLLTNFKTYKNPTQFFTQFLIRKVRGVIEKMCKHEQKLKC